MLKLRSLKANLDKQYQPEWVELSPAAFPDPAWRGVRFNVCSSNLPAYRRAAEAMARQFAKKYDGATIPEAELQAASGKLIAEHLLFGWEGMDEDYSEELAETLLCDLEFASLADAVMWCATKRARVNAEFVENLAKN